MITIYCALYAEAKYIIQYYDLKKETSGRSFQVFFNPDAEVRLVITGVGRINVAVAVAEISTLYPPEDGDIMINFGSCAGGENLPIREIILANKLTDVESERNFYPDMIYQHPFLEGKVESSVKVHGPENTAQIPSDEGMSGNQIAGYDMEAASLYEAGNFYYGPHEMLFLKVVTDHGVDMQGQVAVDKEEFSRIMQDAGERAVVFFDEIRKLMCAQKAQNQEKEKTDATRLALADDLCCSVTMRVELEQLLTYWKLAGYDAKELIDEYYEQGLLPCKDKRVGRRVLNELQSRWL